MRRILFLSFILALFTTFFTACGDDFGEQPSDEPQKSGTIPAFPKINPTDIVSADSTAKINPSGHSDTIPPKRSGELGLVKCVEAKNVKASLLGNGKLNVSGKTIGYVLVAADDNGGKKTTATADKNGQFSISISDNNFIRGSNVSVSASAAVCSSNLALVKVFLLKENQVPFGVPACPFNNPLFGAQPFGDNEIVVYIWKGSMPAYKITACDKKGVCAKEGAFDSTGFFSASLPDTNTMLDDYVYALIRNAVGEKPCAATVAIKVCDS